MSVLCTRICVCLVLSWYDIMIVDSLALSDSLRVSDMRVVFGMETKGSWVQCGRRKVQLIMVVNRGVAVKLKNRSSLSFHEMTRTRMNMSERDAIAPDLHFAAKL